MPRILTYNVHRCLGTDGRLSPERIADVIAAYEPDVVALQELDVGRLRSGGVDQAHAIARALGMHVHFHASLRVLEEQYGNAILTHRPSQLVKAEALPGWARRPSLEPRVALQVAQRMVFFLKRPGGQAQFSAQLSTQMAEREPLRELQAWIVEHPGADLAIDALARRVSMSPRNFFRVFVREVGMTPGRFVERARVEAARRLLEETARIIPEIAAACGFGSSETMRIAFRRTLGVNPKGYRSRFHTTVLA